MAQIHPAIRCLAAVLAFGASAAQAQDDAAAAGFGAKVYAENCNRCHEAPDPASRTRRQWRAIALHMRVSADISREDEQRVLAFLRTYNTASMKREKNAPASR